MTKGQTVRLSRIIQRFQKYKYPLSVDSDIRFLISLITGTDPTYVSSGDLKLDIINFINNSKDVTPTEVAVEMEMMFGHNTVEDKVGETIRDMIMDGILNVDADWHLSINKPEDLTLDEFLSGVSSCKRGPK